MGGGVVVENLSEGCIVVVESLFEAFDSRVGRILGGWCRGSGRGKLFDSARFHIARRW